MRVTIDPLRMNGRFTLIADPDGRTSAIMGLENVLVQLVSHGFISGALFLCVRVMYDRLHSRRIADYGGVANTMPVFASFMMLFALANSGLPGTSGFVGEFLVILGSFQVNFWIALLAGLTLVLGAAYTLCMYKRVVFGEVTNEGVAELSDVNPREFIVLAAAVLLIGLWPAPLLEVRGRRSSTCWTTWRSPNCERGCERRGRPPDVTWAGGGGQS